MSVVLTSGEFGITAFAGGPTGFDGMALDDVPFFHPDGQRLYDMSDRPLPGGEGAGKENIWIWRKGGKPGVRRRLIWTS